MTAKYPVKRVEAVSAASTPNVARCVSKAIAQYPVTGIGSTEYAARVIGARCRLSPAIARKVIELVGMGGAA